MQATIATPSASAPVIFNFTEQAVRIVADDHDNPWFAVTDICNVLGYANSRDALAKHCRESGVAKRDISSGGQMRELTFINEGNLYRLIVKSRKPEAEKFEAWLMDEVLPSIRKTGGYAMRRPASADFSKAKAITQATRLFQSMQRAHAGLSVRQSYLLAASAAHEAFGVDLLAVWKLDPATLPNVSPQAAVARLTKKDGKRRLLEKLVRYIEAAHPVARHQDMLKRMHLHARDFRALVDDAVANGLLLRKSGVEYNYAGTVYVLVGGAA
jgi:prophage antirepressor-like protein